MCANENLRIMSFDIPPELTDVECHLKWMGEIIPYIERSLQMKTTRMEDHIKSLPDKEEDDDNDGGVAFVSDDHFEEEYNEHHPKYCSVYASRLNEAAKLAYLSCYMEAEQQLELPERIYDKLELCHRPAFKYAVDTMKWSMKVLKNYRLTKNASTTEEKDLVLETVEEPIVFRRRYEELQADDKAKAVLRYLWVCLGGTLKISEECVLPVYKLVLSYDPDYHVWYSVVYRAMRGFRRNMQRHESGRLKPPSEEEQKLCQEAYDRNPSIYLSIKDMAIMLKETLWDLETQEEWDREEEKYLRVKRLFEEALSIATERGQNKWTKKIQVYLAEFLLFGRGSQLNPDDGKRLFDTCLSLNPKDTTVLHKVAKLCHYGAARKSPGDVPKYKDLVLAENFYRAALQSKPGNYPCIKDYLKVLRNRQSFKDYIDTVDWVLKDLNRDYQVSDLKILRGCVLWLYNPFRDPIHRKKACDSWLYVVSNLPDFVNSLYRTLESPPFNFGRQPACIKIQAVITTLERMREKCRDREDEKNKFNALNFFIEGLQSRVTNNTQ